ncbi:hypothetical protein BDV97DRAFT_357091 [Delphinella strobiligena]|nr:hypothetical protein BDV97DRAFT_357091 [Delphinella strobiligena]
MAPRLTYALELAVDPRKEISLKKTRQTEDLPLNSAIESDSNAKAANQLAKRKGKLGVLVFIFIPLSFVTSLFSMNITPRGSSPLWHFLAAAWHCHLNFWPS